ncbi:MAG: serine protease [Bacteroidetes bacterium HGW-Bacteroidetes-20]|nr:MAG: serine protease [Bacteroidetes bacterium HGW-Bacteroidetes-20]
MKKITLFLSLFLSIWMVRADEGMWLMMLLNKNIDQMQAMGLKLTAEDIYSVNNSSIKDGVVIFGRGCTGEIISKDGLLLTNHHCGYGNIQALSSEENNILGNGFWAKTKKDELPCEGLTVQFLIRMDEVTNTVLEGVTNEMSEKERNEIIDKNSKTLISDHSENGKYNVRIANMFNGNAYYIFIYQEFKDVRLVGTPPNDLGKFGGDTDNWMWPRHTADFSMFRVYTDKDGNPAAYSPDNIPLKPKFHFPISLAGVQEKDFAMIVGFPGRTDRYSSSYGVKMTTEEQNPVIIAARGKKLEIINSFRQKNKKIDIQYAAKAASISNYWKYSIGQNEQIINNKVIDKKVNIENKFQNWIKENKKEAEYGTVIADFEKIYTELTKYAKFSTVYREAIFSGSELFQIWGSFAGLYPTMSKKDVDKTSAAYKKYEKALENLPARFDKFFKDFNVDVDKKVTAALFEYYYNETTPDQRPEFFNKLVEKYKMDFTKMTEDMYKKSILHNQEALNKFVKNPNAKVLDKDPMYQCFDKLYDFYFEKMDPTDEQYTALARTNRLFVKGIMEMQPEKLFYPNANSMMRLTYGKVDGYEMKDAVTTRYYTTLDGKVAKNRPGSWEFNLPQKMVDLYNAKDFGPYADKDGKMRTCFLTNNDITGGNSGSPVINGKGELIGCAFDGNWEAMSGDIFFETQIQRTIAVDIRYVLFIIDKFGGAKHLVDEMTIVK